MYPEITESVYFYIELSCWTEISTVQAIANNDNANPYSAISDKEAPQAFNNSDHFIFLSDIFLDLPKTLQ